MMPNVPLNRAQIEDILGRQDDLKIARILALQATPGEVLEAKRWVSGYKRTISGDMPLRASVVDRVCDIIRMDEPEWYAGDN